MGIKFRLLGEVDALLDGRPIDVGHARQRCVLAALLVDADRPVGADELVERAWAGRPPQHARSALSGYVSRLRSVLAADPEIRLERRGGGYRLTVDPATVDLHRFTGLLGQAEQQRDHGGPGPHPLDLLTEALELWRGPALGELDTPWANAQRSALDAARHGATLDRNDLALDVGRHTTMLADLLADADAHPLDERLTGQLMLALYRCGRQADALRRYQELRRALAEELGADPGPALQRLHRKILAADPELAWTGSRERAGGRPVPRQLPAAPQTFTGRRAEVVRLDRRRRCPGGQRGGHGRVRHCAGSARPRWRCTGRTGPRPGSRTASCTSTCAASTPAPTAVTATAGAARLPRRARGAAGADPGRPGVAGRACTAACSPAAGCWSCWTTPGTPNRSAAAARYRRAVSWSSPAATGSPAWSPTRAPGPSARPAVRRRGSGAARQRVGRGPGGGGAGGSRPTSSPAAADCRWRWR